MPNANAPIAIVSSGAQLPGAQNPEEFFEQLLKGTCFVRDLRESEDLSYRPLYDLLLDADRAAPDSTYSTMGAAIGRRALSECAAKQGLNASENYILHMMTIEVVRQCLEGVLGPAELKRTDFVFGSSDALASSIEVRLQQVFEHLKDHFDRDEDRETVGRIFATERERFSPGVDPLPLIELSIPAHLGEKVRRRFQLGGEVFLVDAACASSIAAIDVARRRLHEGLCDFVVAGGADDCLGAGNMLSGFSKIGVLSESGPLPFDERSDGTVIGEGAVAFLLTTLKRAEQMNLPILGVIRGLGGSSDGKSGGLTEPTLSGQLKAYERAYGGRRNIPISFVECHGTGTKVGDQVELASLSEFFPNRRIPIGSVKYNIGHTMIAAGAASLLKALKILQHRKIPPSPYFKSFQNEFQTSLYLNPSVESIPKEKEINIGVSSFGFGGTNFHVWLQEYRPGPEDQLTSAPEPSAAKISKVVYCARVEAALDDVTTLFSRTSYNLPPNVWPFVDRAQLLSVLVAEQLFSAHGLRPEDWPKDRVHVISGAAQPLVLAREMVERGLYRYAHRLVERQAPHLAPFTNNIYLHVSSSTTELNAQSAIGSINSLIASRVSKAFDFQGLNLTVDGDGSAGLKALEVARSLLRFESGIAVVLDSIKREDPELNILRTVAMRCHLLASKDFVEEFSLPVIGQLEALHAEGGAGD